tara:strand:- start:36 stop:248 length:213 start_codon:yes stop_codon:yes gene_type:complete
MKRNETGVIKLNKSFYNRGAVEETKKKFIQLCECSIEEDGNYFLINIIPKKSKIDALHFEFANYALALMR